MKIACCILSRDRARRLSALVTGLDEQSTGKNKIYYVIGHDHDDQQTIDMVASLQKEVPNVISSINNPRPLTIGHAWNQCAEAVKADYYMALNDDVTVLAPGWDQAMETEFKGTGEYGKEAISWRELAMPNHVGNTIITKKYYDLKGYLCAPYFPFWFCDTWEHEVYRFTFNHEFYVSQYLNLGGKRGSNNVTTNLRDLSFWWGFFNTTRYLRIREAHRMASTFKGWPKLTEEQFIQTRQKWIDMGITRDKEMRPKIPEFERTMGDKRPAGPRYLEAKANAEQFLRDHGLSPWNEGWKKEKKWSFTSRFGFKLVGS